MQKTPILIFANRISGGGLAGELIDNLSNDPSIHFVRLPEEANSFQDKYQDLLQDPSLRCIVAGGDGSVNWVVTLLTKVYGFANNNNENTNNSQPRPPLAVLPLGTGNDMSRALGWGRGVSKSRLENIQKDILKVRKAQRIKNVDVWNLSFRNFETEEVEHEQTMINYFSIGVDAEVAHDFEDCRLGKCGCCICCQCMSLCCYVPVAIRSMFCKRPISTYLTVDIESTDENNTSVLRRLITKRSEKTLVFQAITSIYAGRDLWGDRSPRSMSDGKIEVLTEGGVWRLGFAQIGCNTAKAFCQGKKATIKATEPLYYQVDGEGFYVNNQCTINVERNGCYPLIFAKEEHQ